MIKINILFTAVGRRVELIRHFKNNNYVIGTDCSDFIACRDLVDKFYKIPKFSDEGYIDLLVNICKTEKVEVLIPLFEKEFFTLCKNKNKFEEIGCCILLSSSKVLDICNDKYKTYEFFKENNIDTPISFIDKELIDFKFPLFIKPRIGMGSQGCFLIKNEKELEFFYEYIKEPIVQEYLNGKEYTIDCFCDKDGNPISIVPRERIEVKGGEVSKSKIIKHKKIISETERLCKCIKGVGPLTIQCFVTNDGKIKFTEINPRFGGGVTLSIKAGVNYSKLIYDFIKNNDMEKVEYNEITMIRYDEAIYD